MFSILKFFYEVKNEFKEIKYPKTKEVLRYTTSTLFLLVAFMFIFILVDSLSFKVMNLVFNNG